MNSPTELICLNCGNITSIVRIRNKKKEGHIKDLYCYICKETTKHYELIDKKIYMIKRLDKIDLTENEKIVMKYLLKRKESKIYEENY